MLSIPGVDDPWLLMLRRLPRDFGDVTPLVRAEEVPAWHPTRFNAGYHTALRLAELVLRATSMECGSGGVTVNGFLLDMPTLFEDFVTLALREALVTSHGGRVDDQDRNHFDEAGPVLLRPDIVWKVRGKPVVVANPKHRPRKRPGTRTPTCTSCSPTRSASSICPGAVRPPWLSRATIA